MSTDRDRPYPSPISAHNIGANYVWSANTVITGVNPITGAWIPAAASTNGAVLTTASEGVLSSLNSTSSALGANAAWTGTSENVTNYNSVVLAALTDASGTAYMQFSPDGTNWDSSLSFSVTSGVNEVHRLAITRPYYRTKYVNGGDAQSFLRLTTIFGSQGPLTSTLNSTVQNDADALLTRSVLMGATENGQYVNVPVTPEGHVEVAIHSPRLPFGSVHTEGLTPVFQCDAVYGINSEEEAPTTGLSFGTGTNSALVTGGDNLFTCSTGPTAFSFGVLQSKRRLRYRAGQGTVGRFAGFWTNPVANSIVIAGFGTAEAGFYYGYSGTSFGILYTTSGIREIQTLTITTGSTATNNYAVRLPNMTTVSLPASNNSSTVRTAYEISTGVFPGWEAEAVGNTVVFLGGSAAPVTGLFELTQPGAGTPAGGTCVETVSGRLSRDTWYLQNQWNGDKLNGFGPSAVTLNPQAGNVYQIGIQYLGFGAITFQIETLAESNNPDFTTVHTIPFPNTSKAVSITQPAFPFTMAAYSAGSASDTSVSVGSFGGFIEGQIQRIGPRMSYFNNTAITSSTSSYVPLFTVKNSLFFKGRANQCVSYLLSVGGAAKSTNGVTTFYLISNATLGGTPNFTRYSNNSTTLVDTSATSCTFADNGQIIWSSTVSEVGDFTYAFKDDQIALQPGDSVTLAVRSVTATAVCQGSLNTREDQ